MSFSVINAIAFYIFLEQTIARKEIKWRKIMFFRSRHLLSFQKQHTEAAGCRRQAILFKFNKLLLFSPTDLDRR